MLKCLFLALSRLAVIISRLARASVARLHLHPGLCDGQAHPLRIRMIEKGLPSLHVFFAAWPFALLRLSLRPLRLLQPPLRAASLPSLFFGLLFGCSLFLCKTPFLHLYSGRLFCGSLLSANRLSSISIMAASSQQAVSPFLPSQDELPWLLPAVSVVPGRRGLRRPRSGRLTAEGTAPRVGASSSAFEERQYCAQEGSSPIVHCRRQTSSRQRDIKA